MLSSALVAYYYLIGDCTLCCSVTCYSTLTWGLEHLCSPNPHPSLPPLGSGVYLLYIITKAYLKIVFKKFIQIHGFETKTQKWSNANFLRFPAKVHLNMKTSSSRSFDLKAQDYTALHFYKTIAFLQSEISVYSNRAFW